jgi:hypothetical protein
MGVLVGALFGGGHAALDLLGGEVDVMQLVGRGVETRHLAHYIDGALEGEQRIPIVRAGRLG